jgi:hypothetical protein
MPMIDVYATEGTFKDKRSLAQDLAKAVMRWEQVPEIPLFLDNTAAFIHDLPTDAISNAAGDSNHVRVQVLTPIHVLDRDKQLGVVKELTEIVTAAADDPALASRTWSRRRAAGASTATQTRALTSLPRRAPRCRKRARPARRRRRALSGSAKPKIESRHRSRRRPVSRRGCLCSVDRYSTWKLRTGSRSSVPVAARSASAWALPLPGAAW